MDDETMAGKLTPKATMEVSSLAVAAIANAFALSSVVFMASDVSGGHVNPAVTFGRVVGGHIGVWPALFYWIAQMVASVMACLVLKITVVGMVLFSFILFGNEITFLKRFKYRFLPSPFVSSFTLVL